MELVVEPNEDALALDPLRTRALELLVVILGLVSTRGNGYEACADNGDNAESRLSIDLRCEDDIVYREGYLGSFEET